MVMGFLYVLAVIAYLIYALCALPLGLLAGVAAYAGGLPVAYLLALGQVLVVRGPALSAPTRRPKPPAGADPAVLQYFYGPALADADHTLRLAWQLRGRFWRWGKTTVAESFSNDLALVTAPVGAGAAIGMPIGFLVGAAAAAVCAVVNMLIVAVAAAATQATGTMLRAVDSAVLRIKNIRMVCPACYQRVAYPAYQCPGSDCHKRHRDIRPGRFGILRRYCGNCRTRMPTLLLFGSSRMEAYCPHQGCGQSMEHQPGKAREFVLPFFGEVGAGKTRLLLSMVEQFREWSEQPGNDDRSRQQVPPELNAEFADTSTGNALGNVASLLSPEVSTAATPPGRIPRAYIVRLKSRDRVHLIQMFDAAGEHFRASKSTQQLRYLDKAHTFILVIDPLSVEAFWDRLLPSQQEELKAVRSNTREPDLTYHHVLEEIQDMRVPVHKARLGVVLSRADLIDSDGPGDVETWLRTELGLGNLVRSARLSFREVGFFRTAAVMENEELDESISPFLRWVLSRNGVSMTGETP